MIHVDIFYVFVETDPIREYMFLWAARLYLNHLQKLHEVYPSLEVMWQLLTASRNGCQATGQHTEHSSQSHLAFKIAFQFLRCHPDNPWYSLVGPVPFQGT